MCLIYNNKKQLQLSKKIKHSYNNHPVIATHLPQIS